MFEQHEREEIRRMEMDKLRRTIANQDAVICEMKGKLVNIRQAQHDATWAMAMEAAATRLESYASRVRFRQKAESVSAYKRADEIRAIPCPPLQTTNEKCD